MTIKKAVGRPPVVTYTTMSRLGDSIQHNSTITEACRFAGISKDTYFRYLKENPVFAEKMAEAKDNQSKVLFSFLTF